MKKEPSFNQSEKEDSNPNMKSEHTVDTYKNTSIYKFSGTFNSFEIESTNPSNGKHAKIFSEISPGAQIEWERKMGRAYSFATRASYVFTRLKETTNNSFQFENHGLFSLGLGFGYSWNQYLQTRIHGQYFNQVFIKALSPGIATADYLNRIQWGIELNLLILERKIGSLNLKIDGLQNLSKSMNDYTMKESFGYSIAPQLNFKLDYAQLEFATRYKYQLEHSSISDQKNSQWYVQFGISFEVD